MKIDKTELFNILTVIATLILGGGNLFELDFGSVPQWAIPILLLVAVAMNWFSRGQVKEEAGLLEQHILDRSLAEDIDKMGLDFNRIADLMGADPEDLKDAVRRFLADDAKAEKDSK